MAKSLPEEVVLATDYYDMGIVQGAMAGKIAQEEADKIGVTVYIRDAITDAILDKREPR